MSYPPNREDEDPEAQEALINGTGDHSDAREKEEEDDEIDQIRCAPSDMKVI